MPCWLIATLAAIGAVLVIYGLELTHLARARRRANQEVRESVDQVLRVPAEELEAAKLRGARMGEQAMLARICSIASNEADQRITLERLKTIEPHARPE